LDLESRQRGVEMSSGDALFSPGEISHLVDPYLIWAQETGWRYVSDNISSDWVSVICRLNGNETLAELGKRIEANKLLVVISPVYMDAGFEHFTALVRKDCLLKLTLMVERLELGTALIPNEEKLVAQYWSSTQESNKPGVCFIGVIDDFVGHSHSSLLSNKRSRIVSIWNQALEKPLVRSTNDYQPNPFMAYGYVLGGLLSSIDANLDQYPKYQGMYSHGSHVTSMLASRGSIDRFIGMTQSGQAVSSNKDEASRCPIVAVHLPQQVVQDTSGGAMAVQILDGIHFILSHLRNKDSAVINVSYGTYAGPHDGTTLLETAIQEILLKYGKRLEIVFPSGNQYDLPTHAVCSMYAGENKYVLNWRVLPDDRTSSFMELWFPQELQDGLQVKLTSPSGNVGSAFVRRGGSESFTSSSGTCCVIFPKRNALSDQKACVLLTIAPTSRSFSGNEAAAHGIWQVEIHAIADQEHELHAYIERDDNYAKPIRGRQSYFVDSLRAKDQASNADSPAAKGQITKDGNYNSIGTAKNIKLVGAKYRKENVQTDYSGRGSVSNLSLNLGDDSRVLRGIRGAGTYGVSTTRMSGTSVAAPRHARELVNIMVSSMNKGSNLQQVAKAVSTSHTPYDSPVP
jgi:hypothetical protein